MRRNLLHISKVRDFKQWLADGNIPHREGRGDYQLLQVQRSGHWHAIYSRLNMPEHVTVSAPLIGLVRAFIRASRGDALIERGEAK